MPHSTDIVAYTFQADIYCPPCVIRVLPTGPGQKYDGWAVAAMAPMETEANLDEIAAAFGIDRQNESSFDSGDFPKVVLRDQVEFSQRCGACGGEGIG